MSRERFSRGAGESGPREWPCAAAAAIGSVLTSGIKSGYPIAYTPGAVNAAGMIATHLILALPLSVSVSSQCAFCSNQTPCASHAAFA